ncbi:isochorismatase hydrolase [Monoraphidium neglectum]|uniref:Isochorismatase hydrolase n=1 Tax=Monoraphidium neglectum TaxID=145388 RepID=A0A0D2MF98_9CHLO|nr:isochorismatase hydrolase [Monoraphidium neglectum]KIY93785.1 isochorismatase hydrolase [Monoraphidium neglectum]|eukprot:XP_013892805.1 isochorismatase hydrolase [Monoraphidium neglectum]
MLDNAQALVAEARKKGVLIVHVPITFTDDYRELRADAYGILANVKAGGAFKKTEWGGAICDAMAPQEGDIIVEGKRGLCGFASTNLDFILGQRKIENIALAGFLTNCCVESSMRSAYEKGYHVFTLKDCCAATSQEAHDAAITHTFPMFSVPVTHGELLAKLG